FQEEAVAANERIHSDHSQQTRPGENVELLRGHGSAPSTPNRHSATFPKSLPAREFDAFLQQRISRVCKPRLDLCDLTAQPAGKSFFQFELCAATIEIVNGLPVFVEGNKPARRALALQFAGNEVYQSTLAARMYPSGIAQIRTTRGVFQDVW